MDSTQTPPAEDDSCPDCWALPHEAHTRDCAIAHDPNAAAMLNTIRAGGTYSVPTDAELLTAIQAGVAAGTFIEVDDAYLARMLDTDSEAV